MSKLVQLILQDGSTYNGISFGYEESVSGELVFNTSMTGYPESLTDPSYKGQILLATYPLIGNYGVPKDSSSNGFSDCFESNDIQVSALIINHYSDNYSHWNANESLSSWLKRNKIPAISGVDTRAITKKLREEGSMLAKIVFKSKDTPFYNPNKDHLVKKVSCKTVSKYGNGKHKIVLVDCGLKLNILRCLLKRDTTIIRVPYDYDFTKEDYDGLFISNGPGDPALNTETINNLKKAINIGKPIFGICLGNQLLALAAGASTYKLKYGHRSHNQPVIKVGTKHCYITSQNHGFAIDHSQLPYNWEPLFVNANDNSCEGIRHTSGKFFAAQFHPEASSGPTDTEFLFDDFISIIEDFKSNA
ncbi:MAG: glutamine-hydrolyzing carbamoyl-phosphate synthase small subunit [Hyphomicrobiales bacterium]